MARHTVDIPDNFVLPASVLRDLRREHPAPPLPVYAALMKDLTIGLYSMDSGAPVVVDFTVPAFVTGYPLYDAADAAKWILDELLRAGYDATLSCRQTDPADRDLWPDRTSAAFPFDARAYDAAIAAPAYRITVA